MHLRVAVLGEIAAGRAAAHGQAVLVAAQGGVVDRAAGPGGKGQGVGGVFHYSIAGFGEGARAGGEEAGPVVGLSPSPSGSQGEEGLPGVPCPGAI